jgi:hypothetical protein
MASSSQAVSVSPSGCCSLALRPSSSTDWGGVDARLPFPWLSSPRWQVAIIEGEAFLGLWLLSGRRRRAAWLSALLVLTLLGAASLYLAIDGQRSCGCFGRVEVNPWFTFALDAVAAAALALTLPSRRGGAEPGWHRGPMTTGIRAAVLLGLLAIPLLTWGNPADALAWMRGESVTVEPEASDLGAGRIGEERAFRVRLTNRAAHPIRIVGGQSNCSCIATDSLPITLEPRQTQEIEVRIRFRGSPGHFVHRFFLFADEARQKVLIARFAGRVIPASE